MGFLRFFGKLLISIGAGVLLFVLWTLYGTGIYTGQQQDALAEEFEAEQSFPQTSSRDGKGVRIQGPPDEFDPAVGEPTFRLEIPKIDQNLIVVEGVEEEQLKKGPGHYPECDDVFQPPLCTEFPEAFPGDKGRVIVSGHRTTYGAPFWDLNKLSEGDEIITETRWGTFRYEVTRTEIVDDQDTSITVRVRDRRELVLTTCHPRFSAAQRLIVHSELVERIDE